MAAKIVLRSRATLMELRKRCSSNQLRRLMKFMAKRSDYLHKVRDLPEGLPEIDWEYYKKNVRSEAIPLVEDFQRKYQSMAIPYPEDKYSSELDKIKEDVQNRIDRFVKRSNTRIEIYRKEIERIRGMMSYAEMTMEDFCLLDKKRAPDFINKPTFWPHDDKEQLGYFSKYEIIKPALKKSKWAERKARKERKLQEAKLREEKLKADKLKAVIGDDETKLVDPPGDTPGDIPK